MRLGLVLLLAALVAPHAAHAEKADAPPAAMRDASTSVIVGTVVGIYTRTERDGGWETTRHVAEVRVQKDEKGGLAAGALAYVRFWTRRWVGPGVPPPSTNGHRGVPKEGETLRIYVVGTGYNGFGQTTDGGLDVYGANGFERLPAPSGG